MYFLFVVDLINQIEFKLKFFKTKISGKLIINNEDCFISFITVLQKKIKLRSRILKKELYFCIIFICSRYISRNFKFSNF